MITTQKLGAWSAIAVLTVVFAPLAWAADSVSAKSAAAATSAKAAVSASSSGIPEALQKALAQPKGKDREKAVIDAAVEWQKSDPAAAFAWMVALPSDLPPSLLNRSILGALTHAWAVRDPAAAVACSWDMLKKKGKCDGNELGALHLTLKQWARSDPKAAVAWTEATVPADCSKEILGWVYGSVAGGYADVDPAAALPWAETVKDDTNRQTAVLTIVDCWYKVGKKPEGIAPLVEKLSHDNLKIAAMRVATGWAKTDASKAKAWVGTLSLSAAEKEEILPTPLLQALALPEGNEREKVMTDAAVEWQKSDPAAAFAWVVAQPPSIMRRSIVAAVSAAWAKRDAPAAVACAWGFAKKPTSDDYYVMLTLQQTVKQWARTDPKAAAAWVDKTVPADTSKEILRWVYSSVAGGWAESDPVACAAWAETVKNAEGRQWGIQALAGTWCLFHKPEDAAVWAKRLPPADLKRAVGHIFEALYRRDAAQATAWLDSLTLPDEMKAELKTKAEATKPKP